MKTDSGSEEGGVIRASKYIQNPWNILDIICILSFGSGIILSNISGGV